MDRIAGGLLGVHAGDALGAGVEFSSWAQIRDRYPDGPREIVGGGPFGWAPGQATDDTDLTRAVLLAYLTPSADVVRAAADNMLAWLDQGPRDVGAATKAGLSRYRQTGDPRQAGAGPGSAGNGSLMRCLPTALAVAERSRRIRESIGISAITHDDPRCTASCVAYNEIVAALLAGASPADAVQVGHSATSEPAVRAAIELGRQLKLAEVAVTALVGLADQARGYVLDSLSLAVAAVLDPRPLPDVLVDIVRVGHDTDTNAAIAGGLLGVRDGLAAIPDKWLAVLQFRDEFRAAAQVLGRRRPGVA